MKESVLKKEIRKSLERIQMEQRSDFENQYGNNSRINSKEKKVKSQLVDLIHRTQKLLLKIQVI